MNQNAKRYLLWGLGGLLVIVLVWLGTGGENESGEGVDESDFKIGGAFSLTGFAAQWGEAERNGVTLALEEAVARGDIAEGEVELVTEDITSNTSQVISAIQKMIAVDGVDIIVGPTWFDSFGGAAPLSDDHDIIMMTPSGVITAVQRGDVHPYVFSTWFQVKEYPAAVAEALQANNETRLALVFEQDAYYEELSEVIEEGVHGEGVEVIETFDVRVGETDFRTVLSRLKQMSPDVVFFGFANEGSQLAFLRQKQEIYPELKLFSNEVINEFAGQEEYRELLQGVRFISPKVSTPAFDQRYKDRFGKEPVFSGSNAYDATNIILAAIAAGNRTSEDIRDYLMNNVFETSTFGEIRFDELGGVEGGEFQVNRIENGKIIPI